MSLIDSQTIQNIITQWVANIGIGGLAVSPIFILYWGIKYTFRIINSMSS